MELSEAQQREMFEIQQKGEAIQRSLMMVQQQVHMQDRDKKRALLTKQEVSTVTANTRCYQSVGRMFVYVPTPELVKDLDQKVLTCDAEMAKCAEKKIYLEASWKETQRNAQELMKQLQQHS
eukprot:TRINITY_DN13405_c0_g1::TRINITY_DN13405_c0_g1_i1::g.9605::m.9605 TRINITY_DN13405_c0_g1::TRINITY_DN13405_c0_g1_i1::g.9605  ORF type:complete len:133 (+),score=13.96,sp/Q54JS0/PFD1_DICDI/28.30/1e-12,Prefoldin_2/PF01920.15/1.4e-13 TRINITY_DN13405_c0_g1_i1:34-399(+)